jgi:uncharacterized integral membrane protein
MQLIMLLGIGIAIGAVVFALQNNYPVVVTLAAWTFEGSLALMLLVALGVGALIAGLLSSPAVIGGKWSAGRLRSRVADLERQLALQQQRARELEVELARHSPDGGAAPAAEKPYVGLRALFSRGDAAPQDASRDGASNAIVRRADDEERDR